MTGISIKTGGFEYTLFSIITKFTVGRQILLLTLRDLGGGGQLS